MTQNERLAIGAGIIALFAYWFRKPIATVTTWAGVDLTELGGMVDYPDKLKEFARAIARAEGFYASNTVPVLANNPGAIKVPGWTGPTLGQDISVFESADAGWSALYRQLMLIVSGTSNIYNLDMSIADMAARWTGTPTEAENWANNVSSTLGVKPDTPLWKAMV